MNKAFPLNPFLVSMDYAGDTLTVVFKSKAGNKSRSYANVPKEIAYGWFYKTPCSETAEYYHQHIKKKFSLVKPQLKFNL